MNPWIYGLAILGFFAIGILISPLWSLLEKEKPKKYKTIYDRENPNHSHLFKGYPKYKDESGYCKVVTKEEIANKGYALTPGRFVGAAEIEDDGEPFEDKMKRLTQEYARLTDESAKLDKEIRKNLKEIGFEI